MFDVDENYETCINSRGRYDEITGTMTLTDGTPIDLDLSSFEQNSVTINGTNVKNKDILFGVVHGNELTMSIYTELDRYALYGAEVNLTFTVYNHKPVDGEEYISSDVDLGIFTIAEVEKKNDIARITAYDNMKKLDSPCGTTVFSGTPFTVLQTVSTHSGVPFDYTAEDMAQFLNYTEVIQFDTTSGAKTYRDIVKYTCQMLGVCCRANRTTGGMELYKFPLTPLATIGLTDRKMSTTSIADYECRFNGFSATSVKGTFKDITRNFPGITMSIDDAPAWDYGLVTSLRDRATNLANYVRQLRYTPCTLSIFTNPIYDCGDMVTVTLSDGSINTLITEFSWSFRSSMTIKSVGTNSILEKAASEESERQVTRNVDANKLVSYDVTNTDSITLNDQESLVICDVNFTSAQATHAMWLANILLESDGDTGDYTDVKITYYYDDVEVPFYPTEHYVDGAHDFSLFFPISAISENAVHTWKVEITSLGGSITINDHNFRGTLFGQNLVEEGERWDGLLQLEDIILYITPIMVTSNLTESSVAVKTYIPANPDLSDLVQYLAMTNNLIGVTDECIIKFGYREDICFCGENYYCGTEGVLL